MYSRVIVPVFLATLAVAQSSDKMVGTWKLDAEKSQMREIASRTLKAEKIAPDTFRIESDLAMKSGEKDHSVTVQICDGVERHKEGAPQAVTETCTPDGSVIRKQDGKMVSEMRSTFSTDGKLQTITHKKLSKDGTWSEAVGIYVRQ
jgi:hypothetical protein